MAFKRATRKDAHIKLAISGPSGSGKTYSALMLAKGMGGKTAILDTEFGSASLYADQFEFDTYDTVDPNGFPPEYFIRAIQEAQSAGYDNFVIDSLSHEWSGHGGCLEIQSRLAQSRYRGNSYQAWAEVTPRHQAVIDAIQAANMNIIATMRSKIDYAITKDGSGKSRVDKLGLAPIQREGMDYEFTILFELDRDSHIASAGKDRTGLFTMPDLIREDTGRRIMMWLRGDAEVAPLQYANPSTFSDKPSSRQGPDPRQYVLYDLEKKIEKGETLHSIMRGYAKMLEIPDVPNQISDLNDDYIRTLARVLYRLKKQVG